MNMTPPRILIIDDMFGRTLRGQRNVHRAKLCGQYQIKDITGDEAGKPSNEPLPEVENPIAEAFFFRGQSPACAIVGDIVQNDLIGCIEAVRAGWFGNVKEGQATWALVLLDLSFETGRVTPESDKRRESMPEGCDDDTDPKKYFGLKLLEELKRQFPDLPVIIFSSMPREDVAREYLEKGGHTFLERGKKDSPQKLVEFIRQYGLYPDPSGQIVGRSKVLLMALRTARMLARADIPVLLRGATGTGKELFANYIHYNSRRSTHPIVRVNMAAIPHTLAESELFGHVKGAFNDAVANRKGLVQSADKGTLFLDEIAEASQDMQAKLFRFFTESTIRPVGGDASVPVDARVISATDQDIEERSQRGAFRPQLLERLRGAKIVLPALEEVKEDIPLLVDHFVREAEAQTEGATSRKVHPEALEILSNYPWPQNVRQLRNVIIEAIVMNKDAEFLVPNHLPPYLTGTLVRHGPLANAREPDSAKVLSVAHGAESLTQIIAAMKQFKADSSNVADWGWKLEELLDAFVRLNMKLFEAAANETGNKTPSNPRGNVQYQAAINRLLAKKISGTAAADLIKRLIRLYPATSEALLKNPVLSELHKRAVEARPSKGKLHSK